MGNSTFSRAVVLESRVEALENESDFGIANLGQFIAAHLADVDAVKVVLTFGRLIEAAD